MLTVTRGYLIDAPDGLVALTATPPASYTLRTGQEGLMALSSDTATAGAVFLALIGDWWLTLDEAPFLFARTGQGITRVAVAGEGTRKVVLAVGGTGRMRFDATGPTRE